MTSIPQAAHTAFRRDILPGPEPSRRLAIVTCMDARIDPAQRLELGDGEAHVIRIAGGSVQEAIRSLIVSQYALQTNEIAVFHHTGCGMTGFEEEMERTVRGRMREELERVNASEDEKKEIEQMGFLGLVGTPTDSVRRDVDLIRQHPLFRNTIITGWVHDIETGRISLVVPCSEWQCAPCVKDTANEN